MASPKKKTTDTVSEKSLLEHTPFQHLKSLIDRRNLPASAPAGTTPPGKQQAAADQSSEEQLFSEAMKGVHPIPGNQAAPRHTASRLTGKQNDILEDDAVSRLARLVQRGEGFVVSDTPEYMEGVGYNARREFAGQLHRGDFSIQGHIDLHGMNVETARDAFESFMRASYLSGKGAVLIIHGRGLSSPGEAILKNKVREWLSQSYWRKRVLAYASAQSHDGGAGATYVLLRDHPVSKKPVKIIRTDSPDPGDK